MTEYFITLPKATVVHKPNLKNWSNSANIISSDDMRLALNSFDTDGQKGLNADELLFAFGYFENKEKEIAVTGKKADGVISSKDIEEIVKTDSRFQDIRQKYNDDSKVTDLLYDIVMTLSAVVSFGKSKRIYDIDVKTIGYEKETWIQPFRAESESLIKHAELEERTKNGKNFKVYTSTDGEGYVTDMDGNRYENPNEVAELLEYTTEKTWFGLGQDKFYETVFAKPKYCGDASLNHQYKIWDENTHSFKNGESKHQCDIKYRGGTL